MSDVLAFTLRALAGGDEHRRDGVTEGLLGLVSSAPSVAIASLIITVVAENAGTARQDTGGPQLLHRAPRCW